MKKITAILFLLLSVTLCAEKVDTEAVQALKDAGKFEKAKEYAKALERHEWYHDNASKIDREQHNYMRRSRALRMWKRLGGKYPPALKALKKRRDDASANCKAGTATAELFGDLASINGILGEPQKTIEVFKLLDEKSPDIAKQCFEYVERLLLKHVEDDLYVKYVGGLKKCLAEKIERYDESIVRWEKGKGSIQSIRYFKYYLTTKGDELSAIAKRRGEPELVLELQKMVSDQFE